MFGHSREGCEEKVGDRGLQSLSWKPLAQGCVGRQEASRQLRGKGARGPGARRDPMWARQRLHRGRQSSSNPTWAHQVGQSPSF